MPLHTLSATSGLRHAGKYDTERQEGVNGRYAILVSVEFWPILTKRGSAKNSYHAKWREIFSQMYAKMRYITFCVGIKRRKLDEQ
ncbi:hypothetical protein VK87_0202070 [Escherichia fergusonii]|nr:hypothetical protein VK87_0202070 [Escherichia fergusonii]